MELTTEQPTFDLLNEMDGILQQRIQDVELHKNLMLQIADLKQKVRRERLQIDEQWEGLIELEKKECEELNAEKDVIESQMKNEHLAASKETLNKSSTLSIDKNTNKLPPSRVGNYTIIAKRLQGEIKNLEQNVADMKARLQHELEHKASIETKVREMRSALSLHRRQDPFTAPTTPIQ
ncbi:uncharacterized protein isoform X1 [Rhodnius prolixus]|uniref:uncharacterized protein isoform X1 n=1 Tax=Rhodnius prolixus TaxID=13249 RepID=UPI003D18BA11